MSVLFLATEGNQARFEPGEVVGIQTRWDFESPPDAIEVRLVWHIERLSEEKPSWIVIPDKSRIENPDAQGDHACQMALPEMPFSFSGKLISLRWGVEVVALPFLEATRLDISVSPDRRSVMLHQDGT